MGLPRVRFTVRAMMVAVAVVALLLVAQPEAVWVGHATIPLGFLILDASTGRPIEGASIHLDLEKENPDYKATTGPDGHAEVVIQAMTTGRSSMVRHTRTVNYGKWMLVVAADGYESLTDDLRKLTLEPRYHYDAAPPPVVIRLRPLAARQ